MNSLDLIKQLRCETDAPVGKCKEALERADWDLDSAKGILRDMGLNHSRTALPTMGALFVVDNVPNSVGILGVKCETDFLARSEKFVEVCSQIAEQATSSLLEFKEIESLLTAELAHFGEAVALNELVTHYSSLQGEALQYYLHHDRRRACVVRFSHGDGGRPSEDQMNAARSISTHIIALSPEHLSPPPGVEDALKEEWSAQAASEGKPANIIGKIVDGKWAGWLKERVLRHQEMFDGSKRTVGDVMTSAGIDVTHWNTYTT